jgi:predicted nucleic acid-binding protein
MTKETSRFPSVFIDTNILYDNFLLNTEKIHKLISYAQYTNTRIYISEISIQELVQKFQERCDELITHEERNNGRISSIDFSTSNIENNALLLLKLKENYEKRLREKTTKNSLMEIVPYKNNMMDECIIRAVKGIKPCKS